MNIQTEAVETKVILKAATSLFYPAFERVEIVHDIGEQFSEAGIEARLTKVKQSVQIAPAEPGVYYFMDAKSQPLYIGKSVHLRQRLFSHIAAAKLEEKALKYVTQADSVQWRTTISDFHAQLLENREIKQCLPLYNRALRRLKRFYTWSFSQKNPAHLQLNSFQVEKLSQQQEQLCYGMYRNAHAAKESIRKLADTEQLCLRVLGLEKGKGACFRSQIGKCAGACAGKETVDEMLERLLDALLPRALHIWPYAKPIQIEENGYWHLLYHWQSFGIFARKLSRVEQTQVINQTGLVFDKDEYRIIRRFLQLHL